MPELWVKIREVPSLFRYIKSEHSEPALWYSWGMGSVELRESDHCYPLDPELENVASDEPNEGEIRLTFPPTTVARHFYLTVRGLPTLPGDFFVQTPEGFFVNMRNPVSGSYWRPVTTFEVLTIEDGVMALLELRKDLLETGDYPELLAKLDVQGALVGDAREWRNVLLPLAERISRLDDAGNEHDFVDKHDRVETHVDVDGSGVDFQFRILKESGRMYATTSGRFSLGSSDPWTVELEALDTDRPGAHGTRKHRRDGIHALVTDFFDDPAWLWSLDPGGTYWDLHRHAKGHLQHLRFSDLEVVARRDSVLTERRKFRGRNRQSTSFRDEPAHRFMYFISGTRRSSADFEIDLDPKQRPGPLPGPLPGWAPY